MREKFKDVEALFESRGRIASFDCLQSVYARLVRFFSGGLP